MEHLHCKSLWLNGHNVLPHLPSVSGKISALCFVLCCHVACWKRNTNVLPSQLKDRLIS